MKESHDCQSRERVEKLYMFVRILYGARISSDIPLIEEDGSGDVIESSAADLAIRAQPAETSEPLAITVDSRQIALGYRLTLYSDRPGLFSEPGRPWLCEVGDIVRFVWEDGQHTVYYQKGAGQALQRVAFWCVHVVIPMYLAFTRGWHFFHASSVVIDGSAALFLAPSMGGKSTLAKFALERGAQFIADDKLALDTDDGAYRAVPSHPCLRYDRAGESLGQLTRNYSSSPAMLAAIFVLERNHVDDKTIVTEQTGLEKFDSLLRHRQYGFGMHKAAAMEFVAGLSQGVPLFSLSRPWGLEFMPDVLNVVERHSRCQKTGR